jgi:DNA repair protein RadC
MYQATSAQPALLKVVQAETYKQKTLFQTMPETERPARRIADLGTQVCTSTELLAAIIGGNNQIEIAQRLMERFTSLRRIYNTQARALANEVAGLSEATAIRILAALATGHRLMTDPPTEQTVINSPADAARLVEYEMRNLPVEHLWVMNLDRRNKVIETSRIYIGSVSSSQIRVAEIFENAVKLKASAIIVFHNHPSGDPTPSPDDVAVTRAIVNAGKMLDIDTLDHVVIGAERWVSLKERGLGFT